MSISFPATRATLRQLHQNAQRNIFRRHQQTRAESTKQQGPSKGSTNNTPPPGWAYYMTPLASPFRAYSAMQSRRPILVQLESTLIIYWIGDLSAQAMGSGGFSEEGSRYEPIRGLRALVIAGICSVPVYKWFLFLGNHFNYGSHLLSLAVKICINQTFFAPIFNTYFFGMQSLLSGGTLEEARKRIIDTVPTAFWNSWKFWPAVTAFSFTYLKPQNRPLFAGCFAVIWQTYLSWLNKNAERTEGVSGKVEEKEKLVERKVVGATKQTVLVAFAQHGPTSTSKSWDIMATEVALLDQQFCALTNLLQFLIEKGWFEIWSPTNTTQDNKSQLQRALCQAAWVLARNNNEVVALTSEGDVAVSWRNTPGPRPKLDSANAVSTNDADSSTTMSDILYRLMSSSADGGPSASENAPSFEWHADVVRRLLGDSEIHSREIDASPYVRLSRVAVHYILSRSAAYGASLEAATAAIANLRNSDYSARSLTTWRLDGKTFGLAEYSDFLRECEDVLKTATDLHKESEECITAHRLSKASDCQQRFCIYSHERMLWDTLSSLLDPIWKLYRLVDGKGDMSRVDKRHKALRYFMRASVPVANGSEPENGAVQVLERLHSCSLPALRRLFSKRDHPDYKRLTKSTLNVVFPKETVVDLLAPAALFTWLKEEAYGYRVKGALAALQVLCESGHEDYAGLTATTALCEVHYEAFVVARACYPQSRTNHKIEFGLSQPCRLPCELILAGAFEDVRRDSPFRPRPAEVWRASFPADLSVGVKRTVIRRLCAVLFDNLVWPEIIAAAEQAGLELPSSEDSDDELPRLSHYFPVGAEPSKEAM
ncbi:hypothetical protein LTR97_012857 [Elasticomyces elasticus]|uniref:Uncharacterized protein n=1 Tax=Elasticomyces elasticus TaxID=574655 RepID=A0AAN7W197_9PEZI|nr:hypothetical protein LTR97_012857 [Elasticomyces elasticus]